MKLIINAELPEFKTFTKIRPIHDVPEIFNCQDVEVTEKINGENLRLWIRSDGIVVGGHERTYRGNIPGFNEYIGFIVRHIELAKLHTFFKRMYGDLDKHVLMIVCEAFGGQRQKGTNYRDDLDVRAISVYLDGTYSDWQTTADICLPLGFEMVPLLYKGKPDITTFNKLLGTSRLSVNNREGEGIVINANMRDSRGKRLWAKYVIPRFAEFKKLDSAPTEKELNDNNRAQRFAEAYVTPARCEKTITRLKRFGAYTGKMSDMKEIMQFLWTDLMEEATEALALLIGDGVPGKLIRAKCTKVMSDYYCKVLVGDDKEELQ